MNRIIAGTAGSVRIAVPPRGTRPTSDKVREAIFSTLESWGFTEDTRVLDLYAGSGALGLEAASRGAAEVTLVEHHGPAVNVMQKNSDAVLKAFRSEAPRIHCKKSTVHSYIESLDSDAVFDVVFLDPPYDMPSSTVSANLAQLHPFLAPDAAVMVERDTRSTPPIWPESYREIRVKKYGETTLFWLEPESSEPENEPSPELSETV